VWFNLVHRAHYARYRTALLLIFNAVKVHLIFKCLGHTTAASTSEYIGRPATPLQGWAALLKLQLLTTSALHHSMTAFGVRLPWHYQAFFSCAHCVASIKHMFRVICAVILDPHQGALQEALQAQRQLLGGLGSLLPAGLARRRGGDATCGPLDVEQSVLACQLVFMVLLPGYVLYTLEQRSKGRWLEQLALRQAAVAAAAAAAAAAGPAAAAAASSGGGGGASSSGGGRARQQRPGQRLPGSGAAAALGTPVLLAELDAQNLSPGRLVTLGMHLMGVAVVLRLVALLATRLAALLDSLSRRGLMRGWGS
jgi:hypothetical protein